MMSPLATEVPFSETPVTELVPSGFLKPLPVIVTGVPTWPDVGVNDVTLGVLGNAVKPVKSSVPPGVVTSIVPLSAPAGTVAMIDVALTTEKLEAIRDVGAPVKVTDVAPVKSVPVKITWVPAAAEVGLKLVITGGSAPAKVICGELSGVRPLLEARISYTSALPVRLRKSNSAIPSTAFLARVPERLPSPEARANVINTVELETKLLFASNT